jgi:hypothetical protein
VPATIYKLSYPGNGQGDKQRSFIKLTFERFLRMGRDLFDGDELSPNSPASLFDFFNGYECEVPKPRIDGFVGIGDFRYECLLLIGIKNILDQFYVNDRHLGPLLMVFKFGQTSGFYESCVFTSRRILECLHDGRCPTFQG